jgi:hypothetical protein
MRSPCSSRRYHRPVAALSTRKIPGIARRLIRVREIRDALSHWSMLVVAAIRI